MHDVRVSEQLDIPQNSTVAVLLSTTLFPTLHSVSFHEAKTPHNLEQNGMCISAKHEQLLRAYYRLKKEMALLVHYKISVDPVCIVSHTLTWPGSPQNNRF